MDWEDLGPPEDFVYMILWIEKDLRHEEAAEKRGREGESNRGVG
jgi:hypothetical protein